MDTWAKAGIGQGQHPVESREAKQVRHVPLAAGDLQAVTVTGRATTGYEQGFKSSRVDERKLLDVEDYSPRFGSLGLFQRKLEVGAPSQVEFALDADYEGVGLMRGFNPEKRLRV